MTASLDALIWKFSYAGLNIALESVFKFVLPANVESLYSPLDALYLTNAFTSF